MSPVNLIQSNKTDSEQKLCLAIMGTCHLTLWYYHCNRPHLQFSSIKTPFHYYCLKECIQSWGSPFAFINAFQCRWLAWCLYWAKLHLWIALSRSAIFINHPKSLEKALLHGCNPTNHQVATSKKAGTKHVKFLETLERKWWSKPTHISWLWSVGEIDGKHDHLLYQLPGYIFNSNSFKMYS